MYPWIAVAIIAALHVVCYFTLPHLLDRASWVGGLQVPKTPIGTVGWPFKRIGPYQNSQMKWRTTLFLPALLGWCCYITIALIENSCPIIWRDLPPLFTILGGVLSFLRLVIYLPGYRWPVSFLGRLVLGRWIIPSYDKVFVAPACIFLFGMVLDNITPPACMSLAAYYGLTAFALALTALVLPPTLEQWHLTGNHRIVVGLVIGDNSRANRQRTRAANPAGFQA
jgi:hypothetical protein